MNVQPQVSCLEFVREELHKLWDNDTMQGDLVLLYEYVKTRDEAQVEALLLSDESLRYLAKEKTSRLSKLFGSLFPEEAICFDFAIDDHFFVKHGGRALIQKALHKRFPNGPYATVCLTQHNRHKAAKSNHLRDQTAWPEEFIDSLFLQVPSHSFMATHVKGVHLDKNVKSKEHQRTLQLQQQMKKEGISFTHIRSRPMPSPSAKKRSR